MTTDAVVPEIGMDDAVISDGAELDVVGDETADEPDAGRARALRLSVVIPVYNEDETIANCLDLLIEQFDHIAEIVVVDNNSSDRSREIIDAYVARHQRKIRVIDESQQGLVYARNAGMDCATGDLIARIDADTRVPANWAAMIVEFFTADEQQQWATLCGRGAAYGLPMEGRLTRWVKRALAAVAALRSRLSGRPTIAPVTDAGLLTEQPREIPVLYGSNMILRRETWHGIRGQVSMRRDIFEDVDMGLCVQDINGRNAFLVCITVGVSPRRMETGLRAFVEYMSFLPRTLLLHRRYALAGAAIFGYLPMVIIVHAARLLLIRAHDADTATFAVRHLFRSSVERGLP